MASGRLSIAGAGAGVGGTGVLTFRLEPMVKGRVLVRRLVECGFEQRSIGR